MSRRTAFPLTPLYEPLSHVFSFRLLELGPETFAAGIKAKLIPVAFGEDPPSYEALSYTWGKDTVKNKITVDNREVLITQNCHDALIQLRRRSKPRMLWIDSLCIDQSSVSERNHQVRLMGEIYRNAKLVLVWLGNEDLWSQCAFRFLQRFREFGKAAGKGEMDFAMYDAGMKGILDDTLEDERRTLQKAGTAETFQDLEAEGFKKPRRAMTGDPLGLVKEAEQEIESPIRSKSLPTKKPELPAKAEVQANENEDAEEPPEMWREAIEGIEALLTPVHEEERFEALEKPPPLRDGGSTTRDTESQSKAPSESTQIRCQSLHELLKRPWFSRMWTIQEVALARDCLILSGKAFITWQDFVEAITHLQAQPGYQDISMQLMGHVYSRARLNPEEQELLSPKVQSEDMKGILTLLNSCRSKDSTDARDKVFALFGLLHAQKYNVFEPDYGRALEEVYIGMAEFVLKTENSLSLLLYSTPTSSCPNRERLDLPSWVPDWSDSSFDEYLLAYSSDHYIATTDMWHLLGIKPRKYMADRDARLRFNLSDRGRKLNVEQSLRIDVVQYVRYFPIQGSPAESDLREKIRQEVPDVSPESLDLISTDWAMLIPFLRRCLEAVQQPNSPHPLIELCSALSKQDPLDEEMEESFQAWRSCIKRSSSNHFSIYPSGETPTYTDEYFTTRSTLSTHSLSRLYTSSSFTALIARLSTPPSQIGLSILRSPPALKFHLHLLTALHARSIFLTANNRLGATPIPNIAEHDTVFILKSLGTPVLLRFSGTFSVKNREEFVFVGPAYLTGAMEGQLYYQGMGEDVTIV